LKKEIVIVVSPDGEEIKVEAKGFKGKGCTEATKLYEQDLGVAGKRKWKPAALVQNQQGVGSRAISKLRS